MTSLCGHLLELPHTWESNLRNKRHAVKGGATGVEPNGASPVLLSLESSASALALSLLRLFLICHHLHNTHGKVKASTEDLKVKEFNLSQRHKLKAFQITVNLDLLKTSSTSFAIILLKVLIRLQISLKTLKSQLLRLQKQLRTSSMTLQRTRSGLTLQNKSLNP